MIFFAHRFVIIVGMGSGGFFSLQCSITAQLVGSHRLDKALSAIEAIESIGLFAGPVSGGFLLDAFGGPTAGAKAYRPIMASRLVPFKTMGLRLN